MIFYLMKNSVTEGFQKGSSAVLTLPCNAICIIEKEPWVHYLCPVFVSTLPLLYLSLICSSSRLKISQKNKGSLLAYPSELSGSWAPLVVKNVWWLNCTCILVTHKFFAVILTLKSLDHFIILGYNLLHYSLILFPYTG